MVVFLLMIMYQFSLESLSSPSHICHNKKSYLTRTQNSLTYFLMYYGIWGNSKKKKAKKSQFLFHLSKEFDMSHSIEGEEERLWAVCPPEKEENDVSDQSAGKVLESLPQPLEPVSSFSFPSRNPSFSDKSDIDFSDQSVERILEGGGVSRSKISKEKTSLEREFQEGLKSVEAPKSSFGKSFYSSFVRGIYFIFDPLLTTNVSQTFRSCFLNYFSNEMNQSQTGVVKKECNFEEANPILEDPFLHIPYWLVPITLVAGLVCPQLWRDRFRQASFNYVKPSLSGVNSKKVNTFEHQKNSRLWDVNKTRINTFQHQGKDPLFVGSRSYSTEAYSQWKELPECLTTGKDTWPKHFGDIPRLKPEIIHDLQIKGERLGSGFASNVYQTGPNTLVRFSCLETICTQRSHFTNEKEALSRVYNNWRIAKSIPHITPNPLGFYHIPETNTFLIRTAYYPHHRTLESFLEENVFITGQQAQMINNNLYQTLQRLHTKNLGHGDLHTENILLSPFSYRIRLIDFDTAHQVYIKTDALQFYLLKKVLLNYLSKKGKKKIQEEIRNMSTFFSNNSASSVIKMMHQHPSLFASSSIGIFA